MRLNYIIIIAGISVTVQLHAQTTPKDTTLNRTVIVEQQYNPDIMDARKINAVPEIKEPEATQREVQYDEAVSPASSISGTPMAVYAGKEVQPKAKPGYIRLGYGNNGNLDAKANYLLDISEADKLNFSFGMDGMKTGLDNPFGPEDWDHYYYKTRVGIDYLHRFSRMDLNASGNFGLSNFNLMYTIPRQRYTSGDIKVAIASTDDDYHLKFRFGTNILFYSRQYDPIVPEALRETLVRTHGDVYASIDDEQQIGVYGEVENIFYNKEYENATLLSMKPYYTFNNDSWQVHLGAHVDLGFGFGKKVQFAPDITANYLISDSYVLYVKATGGRLRNDFRRLEQLHPYAELISSNFDHQLEDTYEQVNARLGFKASPANGLWFNLYGGYQNTKKDLDYAHITSSTVSVVATPVNTNNVYAGARLTYEFKDFFDVALKGEYHKWDKKEDVELLSKPKFELDFQVNARPITGLLVNAGYEYVKREAASNYFRNTISNLYAGATYNLFEGISIYARTSNLLNKKHSYYTFYPSQGINFVGGMSFVF